MKAVAEGVLTSRSAFQLAKYASTLWCLCVSWHHSSVVKVLWFVTENEAWANIVLFLCRKLNVECPIIAGIYRVIHENADARSVVSETMSRELRPEVDPELFEAAARQH